MTTKELLDIRKATNGLMELSKRVRSETEVVQCCLRDLDDIAHEVQNLAYDMGVDAADLSELPRGNRGAAQVCTRGRNEPRSELRTAQGYVPKPIRTRLVRALSGRHASR